MNRLLEFLKERIFLVVGIFILAIGVGGYFLWPKVSVLFVNSGPLREGRFKKVDQPTIVNGELILPKVYSGGLIESKDKIQVLSAFLVGVFEEQQQQQQQNPFGGPPPEPPKLVGIRILGEINNSSKSIVKEISPVVKFYDPKNKLIAQKIGKVTPGFDFFSFKPGEKTVYDILVENPPFADKLEILFNAAASEKKPSFEILKISEAALEVKIAKYQQQAESEKQKADNQETSTESGEASKSATPSASPTPRPTAPPKPEEVEYYILSGTVTNNLVDSVSDVAVYAWVKNKEGKVISFARQDYKGDLLSPKKKVKFKINLLPFKVDEKMESYGVGAWGKRYKL